MMLVGHYHNIITLQRNPSFFATFNNSFLANPNNLLTHTHTHTHYYIGYRYYIYKIINRKGFRAGARDAYITLINKGLMRVPFVQFLMHFLRMKR